MYFPLTNDDMEAQKMLISLPPGHTVTESQTQDLKLACLTEALVWFWNHQDYSSWELVRPVEPRASS